MKFTYLLFTCFSLVLNAETILIKNARIFNGVDPVLTKGHVVIKNGLITQVSSKLPHIDSQVQVIDAKNRILTPGFIDIHAHIQENSPLKYSRFDRIVRGAFAAKAAEFTVRHGFTSVRDAGGTTPDLAKVINDGALVGPRIFSSGAYISQTSGHGDWRQPHEPNPLLIHKSPYLMEGNSILADGVAQVLTATRENLKKGAIQIKLMGGGGVLSDFDPIHTIQYTPAEIRAAVQAASDWGTYVMAHAYTRDSIARLINNGVKSIEHALLIDDKTAKLAADKGVVLSTQAYIFGPDEKIPEGLSQESIDKNNYVKTGLKPLIKLIKKYNIKTGFGTDLFFGSYDLLGEEFAARANYWTPFEILRQATSENAEIIRMAGPLVRVAKFGEIRQGWLADLLLLDGEPHEDITELKDLNKAVRLVMKGGEIIVNKLD